MAGWWCERVQFTIVVPSVPVVLTVQTQTPLTFANSRTHVPSLNFELAPRGRGG